MEILKKKHIDKEKFSNNFFVSKMKNFPNFSKNLEICLLESG